MEKLTINIEDLNEDERYLFDERSGIYEYDGKLPREEAEKRAYQEIISKKNIQLKLI